MKTAIFYLQKAKLMLEDIEVEYENEAIRLNVAVKEALQAINKAIEVVQAD